MAELLKHRYSATYIQRLATIAQHHHPVFDIPGFSQQIFDSDWEARELKSRMHHITLCLHQQIGMSYPSSIQLLSQMVADFSGFEAMFFPDYVMTFGLDDWDTSMEALALFTQYSSSEFAVRPFILQNPERMMAQMLSWSTHPNEHVRRLSSEGCRPRLPWAPALPLLKQSPTMILPILEQLKQDSSLYVRRSVANNLNDISKDNPQVTGEIANRWLGQHSTTDWLVKHGCRTLLKKADPEILKLFGYDNQSIDVVDFKLSSNQLSMGETLGFTFSLTSDGPSLGKVRAEYAIDFVKANGQRSRKLFKISESSVQTNRKAFKKSHCFKPLSTRKHYPGEHRITLQINGQEKGCLPFQLQGTEIRK